jgi:phosphoglycolate phosphatase-like HAD superfamily hydrolase
MELTGVTDARRVAKVGDTPSDLQEGRAAGCGLVIGVTNGSHTREQLEPHPHTHLIDNLRELPGLLLGDRSKR